MHSEHHKMMFGAFVMLCGVGIVKVSLIFQGEIIHFFGDVVGYLTHGIGAIPYAEKLTKSTEGGGGI